jgi:acyl carrier protein phosphodiesterase
MNWLSHAFLSKPDVAFRVGNILPDLVSITELKKFSLPIQAGIRCHQAIDIFTDAHPIVKNSINRLPVNYKRYGGILTDVFYDHFLAKNWNQYSPISLNDFTSDFSTDLKFIKHDVPEQIFTIFQRILRNNIFESYRDIDGISLTLKRIDSRLRKPVNLDKAIVELENHYAAYETEFSAFFNELQIYIQPYIIDSKPILKINS